MSILHSFAENLVLSIIAFFVCRWSIVYHGYCVLAHYKILEVHPHYWQDLMPFKDGGGDKGMSEESWNRDL